MEEARVPMMYAHKRGEQMFFVSKNRKIELIHKRVRLKIRSEYKKSISDLSLKIKKQKHKKNTKE